MQNIEFLEAGDVQLAFVTTGVALQAWNATGAWAGRAPARSLRALFPMYDTPFVFLVLQNSANHIDLREFPAGASASVRMAARQRPMR